MLQDVFLFTGDIASNIRLNNEELTDDEVYRALKRACADSFINSLPNGIKSEVKERGVHFSSGSVSFFLLPVRVALNPAVLILGEATAYIDTETEEMIQRSMENVTSGRTSILIAHRLSTIRQADRIYVITEGKILEEGDHETLLNLNGLYRNYVELSLKSRKRSHI